MRKILAALVVFLFMASGFATAMAQTNTTQIEIKVEIKDTTSKVEAEIGETEMEFTLNTTDRDVVIEEIAVRTGLSIEQVRGAIKFETEETKEHEKKKSELEIEAETENGTTKVKVEINETETEFTLDTTNRDIIIDEIAVRTGLSTELIRKVIKFEEEFEKKIRKIDFPVKKKSVVYQLKQHLVGMDAVIEFAKELGKDTTALEGLRADFKAVLEEIELLQSTEEKDPFGRHVSEARKIANEFRKTGNDLLGDQVQEARERVKKALEEDKDGVLAGEADDIRAEEGSHGINSFDSHVENAQKKIDRLTGAGYNVAAAQEKLDEIKGKRPALVNATEAFINSCLGKPLTCNNSEHAKLKELRKEIREEFKDLDEIIKEIRLNERFEHLADKLVKTLERAEKVIAEAEQQGLDVTVYKNKLDEVLRILEEAKAKAQAGNVKEAMEDIRSAHAALTNVLKDLAKDRREFLKALKEQKEAERYDEHEDKLEKTLERAEKVIAEAAEQGIDVTAYKAALQEVRDTIAKAREKAEAGDVKSATADLRKINAALNDVLKDLEKARKAVLKEQREEKKDEKKRNSSRTVGANK